jgi:hypothetical protein
MNYSWPDIVNGTWEIAASMLVFNHCRVALRDKAVAGVSILSVGLFACWGLWKLFYYPHLNQPISLAGGVVLMSANVVWVSLLLHYRKRRVRSAAAVQTPPSPPPRHS